MDSAAASCRRLETVGATRHALPSATEAWRQRQGCHPHGTQQSRAVASHPDGGALLGAPRRLLRFAWAALSRETVMAQPAEPPWYGPVCPVVWEGRHREMSPYPDQLPRACSDFGRARGENDRAGGS